MHSRNGVSEKIARQMVVDLTIVDNLRSQISDLRFMTRCANFVRSAIFLETPLVLFLGLSVAVVQWMLPGVGGEDRPQLLLQSLASSFSVPTRLSSRRPSVGSIGRAVGRSSRSVRSVR